MQPESIMLGVASHSASSENSLYWPTSVTWYITCVEWYIVGSVLPTRKTCENCAVMLDWGKMRIVDRSCESGVQDH